jgi:hypothetical protein
MFLILQKNKLGRVGIFFLKVYSADFKSIALRLIKVEVYLVLNKRFSAKYIKSLKYKSLISPVFSNRRT